MRKYLFDPVKYGIFRRSKLENQKVDHEVQKEFGGNRGRKDERKAEKKAVGQGHDRKVEDANREKSQSGKDGDRKVQNRSRKKKDGDDIRAILATENGNIPMTKDEENERKKRKNEKDAIREAARRIIAKIEDAKTRPMTSSRRHGGNRKECGNECARGKEVQML